MKKAPEDKRAHKKPYRAPELRKRDEVAEVAEGFVTIVTDGGPRPPG